MAYSTEFGVFFLSTARRRKQPAHLSHSNVQNFCHGKCQHPCLPASMLSAFAPMAHFTVLRTPVFSSPLHLCLCESFFTKSHGNHSSGLCKGPMSLRKYGLFSPSQAKQTLQEPGSSLCSRFFLAMPKCVMLLQTMQAVVGLHLLTSALVSYASQCCVHKGGRVCGDHLVDYMGVLVNRVNHTAKPQLGEVM